MKNNWQFMLLALALAVAAWLQVSGREKVEAWIEAPVQLVGKPQDLVIRDGLRNRIGVRVRGPKGLAQDLDKRSLVYLLDLSKLQPGPNVIRLESEGMALPRSFELVEFDPARLEVNVDRIAEKLLPVIPIWNGSLHKDYRLVETQCDPEIIRVRGPEALVKGMANVETSPIHIPTSKPEIVEEKVALELPKEIQAEPAEAMVRLVFGVKTKDLSLKAPVQIINNGSFTASLLPVGILLFVELPLPMARSEDTSHKISVKVVVDKSLGPGVHLLTPVVVAPPGCRVLKVEPEALEVTLKE